MYGFNNPPSGGRVGEYQNSSSKTYFARTVMWPGLVVLSRSASRRSRREGKKIIMMGDGEINVPDDNKG